MRIELGSGEITQFKSTWLGVQIPVSMEKRIWVGIVAAYNSSTREAGTVSLKQPGYTIWNW